VGSQGVIEENDLSEGGDTRPRARARARTHARQPGSIRDAYSDVYVRLCAFTLSAGHETVSNQGAKSSTKNTAEKIDAVRIDRGAHQLKLGDANLVTSRPARKAGIAGIAFPRQVSRIFMQT